MQARRRGLSRRFFFSLALAWTVGSQPARADGVVPSATEMPDTLSLDEAVRIFRTRGLDLLMADAATRSAEGAVRAAGAVPNPTVTASVGNGITFSQSAYSASNCLQNGAQCTPWVYNLGITDSAALEDSVSGKRDLRQVVARNALAAAKMNRADAERTILFQVETAYLQVAQATLGHRFAKDVAASNALTLTRFQTRFRAGAINDGDLQRIETQKLESDQGVELALQNLRQARAALALLLGVRGEVPEFDVDTKVLDFSVPAGLKDATATRLLRTAFDHRPDLLALGYEMASNEAQIRLTRRQRFPDVSLGVNYSWGGFGGLSTNGPLGPQVLTFSLSSPIPVFYQLAGEIRQAEAQYDTTALQRAKTTAQVVNDVTAGLASFTASRALVERMEGPRRPGGGLLESAKGAFDVVAIQYEKGAASITDLLDALRTYIATRVEYFLDLTNYWTAVFQLELAVAAELRP
jgi:cobalt-zinc-cadmium efflux system outer membrane protein